VVLQDPEAMAWGGELLLRDGEPAGLVTSAAWGDAVGAAVGLGYLAGQGDQAVTADFVRAGRYEVSIGGEICPATVSLRPPFDPDGTRLGRA
jgi:4-methylaminobutanoate oxidase (formaldehyde-forming)